MTVLTPAPDYWPDFPLPLVRLMEETYDILVAETGKVPTWAELMAQMVLWLPGIGLDPWPDWEEGVGIPARRYMMRHMNRYRLAGCPEGGVEPVQLIRPQLPRAVTTQEGFCRNGHDLSVDNNLRVRSSGRMDCRACRRAYERRKRNEEKGSAA